ncbi:MAG: KamA family radical SAM protein, partial [Nitrospinales bacterium]
IRIGTRVPGTLPQRITETLCNILKKHHPIYFNMHFNHPSEITPEVETACNKLADAGIPLGSQTVLLKDVNDNSETMKELFHKMLRLRIKPYYLFQADMTMGTNHFRTMVQKGLDIIRDLQGHTSGMAVPYFVIDTPGGGGKVRLLPESIVQYDEKEVVVKNFEGKVFRYPQPVEKTKIKRDASPEMPTMGSRSKICELA